MPLPHPLPEPIVELVAQRFRVIGEPMRIRILDRLRDGEATVAELTEHLATSQQNVSKHLGVLHQAGILSRQKTGRARSTRLPTRASSRSVSRSAAGCSASSRTSPSSSEGRCDELLTTVPDPCALRARRNDDAARGRPRRDGEPCGSCCSASSSL